MWVALIAAWLPQVAKPGYWDVMRSQYLQFYPVKKNLTLGNKQQPMITFGETCILGTNNQSYSAQTKLNALKHSAI